MLSRSEIPQALESLAAQLRTASLKDYSIISHLGSGSYGSVKLAVHKPTQKKVAIKIIDLSSIRCGRVPSSEANELLESIPVEIAVMRKLRHPHVVELYDVLFDRKRDSVYMIIEYMAGGSVMTWDSAAGSFKWSPLAVQTVGGVRAYLVQICLALHALHTNNIIHRDIKPENILLDCGKAVKLCDFGVSSVVASSTTDVVGSARGTLAFLPPEAFAPSPQFRGRSADIYALGVTLYCMLFGRPPRLARSYAEMQRLAGEPTPIPEQCPALLRNLLERVLAPNPADRISLDSIISHPWVCGSVVVPVASQRVAVSDGDIAAGKPRDVDDGLDEAAGTTRGAALRRTVVRVAKGDLRLSCVVFRWLLGRWDVDVVHPTPVEVRDSVARAVQQLVDMLPAAARNSEPWASAPGLKSALRHALAAAQPAKLLAKGGHSSGEATAALEERILDFVSRRAAQVKNSLGGAKGRTRSRDDGRAPGDASGDVASARGPGAARGEEDEASQLLRRDIVRLHQHVSHLRTLEDVAATAADGTRDDMLRAGYGPEAASEMLAVQRREATNADAFNFTDAPSPTAGPIASASAASVLPSLAGGVSSSHVGGTAVHGRPAFSTSGPLTTGGVAARAGNSPTSAASGGSASLAAGGTAPGTAGCGVPLSGTMATASSGALSAGPGAVDMVSGSTAGLLVPSANSIHPPLGAASGGRLSVGGAPMAPTVTNASLPGGSFHGVSTGGPYSSTTSLPAIAASAANTPAGGPQGVGMGLMLQLGALDDDGVALGGLWGAATPSSVAFDGLDGVAEVAQARLLASEEDPADAEDDSAGPYGRHQGNSGYVSGVGPDGADADEDDDGVAVVPLAPGTQRPPSPTDPRAVTYGLPVVVSGHDGAVDSATVFVAAGGQMRSVEEVDREAAAARLAGPLHASVDGIDTAAEGGLDVVPRERAGGAARTDGGVDGVMRAQELSVSFGVGTGLVPAVSLSMSTAAFCEVDSDGSLSGDDADGGLLASLLAEAEAKAAAATAALAAEAAPAAQPVRREDDAKTIRGGRARAARSPLAQPAGVKSPASSARGGGGTTGGSTISPSALTALGGPRPQLSSVRSGASAASPTPSARGAIAAAAATARSGAPQPDAPRGGTSSAGTSARSGRSGRSAAAGVPDGLRVPTGPPGDPSQPVTPNALPHIDVSAALAATSNGAVGSSSPVPPSPLAALPVRVSPVAPAAAALPTGPHAVGGAQGSHHVQLQLARPVFPAGATMPGLHVQTARPAGAPAVAQDAVRSPVDVAAAVLRSIGDPRASPSPVLTGALPALRASASPGAASGRSRAAPHSPLPISLSVGSGQAGVASRARAATVGVTGAGSGTPLAPAVSNVGAPQRSPAVIQKAISADAVGSAFGQFGFDDSPAAANGAPSAVANVIPGARMQVPSYQTLVRQLRPRGADDVASRR